MSNVNNTEIAFFKSKANDPALTDFVHFGRAVVFTGVSRATIQKRMSKLLNRKDYPDFTLDEILDHFQWLSNLENATKSAEITAQHSVQFWTKSERRPKYRPEDDFPADYGESTSPNPLLNTQKSAIIKGNPIVLFDKNVD